MNAQVRNYELYRVILDYEALQDGFLDRIDELNAPMTEIDIAGGLTRGHTQRLLSKGEGIVRKYKPSCTTKRTFGWESLGKMLKGTGLALVLVVDDERFAEAKSQLIQRKRPRQQANASSTRPTWLFTKEKAREMGKKRWSAMSPAKRKRLARKAGKASARARRRRGELLKLATLPACADVKSQTIT